LYYTASGIVTPAGGRPVRRLREDSLNTINLLRNKNLCIKLVNG